MTEPDVSAAVQEIRQFALRARTVARHQATQQACFAGTQVPTKCRTAAVPATEGSRLDALSTFPRAPSIMITKSSFFDRVTSENASSGSFSSIQDTRQAAEDFRRTPWFFSTPVDAPGMRSSVYQAEKAANAAARKRLLQLLGPEFGSTADTVGVSHIPRPLRFHRAATVPVEQGRGPGKYDVNTKAEEAVSQRGMFGYKTNLVFGPPKEQPRGRSRSDNVTKSLSHAQVRKAPSKVSARLQQSQVALIAPREILLSEIALALHIQATDAAGAAESEFSEDSFWSSDGDRCEGSSGVREDDTIASSSVALPVGGSTTSQISVRAESAADVERSGGCEWCRAQHHWFTLLGRERHRRKSSKLGSTTTSKRPVRDIVWSAPSNAQRGRAQLRARNRTQKRSYSALRDLLEGVDTKMAHLLKSAEKAYTGEEVIAAPQRLRASSIGVNESSYYKGRQVGSWKAQQNLEAFHQEILRRTGWRKRENFRWYASQLHPEYNLFTAGGRQLRSQSAPASRRTASEVSPPLLRIGGSSVHMSAQAGRDDQLEEDAGQGVLLYNSQVSKDYIQRRSQRTPAFAKMAGRPESAEPAAAEYSLCLEPIQTFTMPSAPFTKFARADRFMYEEDTKNDELELNPYTADRYFRSERIHAVPEFKRQSGRDDDNLSPSYDNAILDIHPEAGLRAVHQRASKRLYVDYQRGAGRSRSESHDSSDASGPVLDLKPIDISAQRLGAGVLSFGNAERWNDSKMDEELLIDVLCDDTALARAAVHSALLRKPDNQQQVATNHPLPGRMSRMTGRESEETFDMADAIRHLGL